MKSLKNSKKIIQIAIFAIVIATLSSCNRGMGCPTFSIGDTIETFSSQINLSLRAD